MGRGRAWERWRTFIQFEISPAEVFKFTRRGPQVGSGIAVMNKRNAGSRTYRAEGHLVSDRERSTFSKRKFQTRGAFSTKPVGFPVGSIANCIE